MKKGRNNSGLGKSFGCKSDRLLTQSWPMVIWSQYSNSKKNKLEQLKKKINQSETIINCNYVISDISWEFSPNPFSTFCVASLTERQTNWGKKQLCILYFNCKLHSIFYTLWVPPRPKANSTPSTQIWNIASGSSPRFEPVTWWNDM